MAKKQRYDYFEAFSRQAEIACEASEKLVDIFEHFQPEKEGWLLEQLDIMREIEHRGDEVSHETFNRLSVEFIAPLDREDVSEITQLLDEVTDKIEEVAQHLYMYCITEIHPNAIKVVRVIDESTRALRDAVKAFDEFKKPKKLDRLLTIVHDRESDGDELYIESKHDLFANHADDTRAYLLGWNSMFSHMESCCDVCEKVASVMQTVALKNS